MNKVPARTAKRRSRMTKAERSKKTRLSQFITGRPKTKVTNYVASDPQAQYYYAMERSMIGTSIECYQSMTHLRRVAKWVCRKYCVPSIPIVQWVEETKADRRVLGAHWTEPEARIMLNPDFHGQNISILAHELAHHIAERKYGLDIEAHGPEFAGTHMDILDSLNIMPKVAYLAMAEEWDVVVKELP